MISVAGYLADELVCVLFVTLNTAIIASINIGYYSRGPRLQGLDDPLGGKGKGTGREGVVQAL